MVTFEIRLPDSLHERLRFAAEQQGISINSLISTAIAEKVSALESETLLLERAREGSRVEPMFTSCPCTRRTHVRKAQRVTRNAFLGVLTRVPSDRRWTDLKRVVQCLRTAVN